MGCTFGSSAVHCDESAIVFTFQQLSLVKMTWTAILEDSCPGFKNAKCHGQIPYGSCREWFCSLFFSRMQALSTTPLVSSDKSIAGYHLVQVISLCIDEVYKLCDFTSLDISEKVNECVRVGQRKVDRHVKWKPFSDILLLTLSEVYGNPFDIAVQAAWKILYDALLYRAIVRFFLCCDQIPLPEVSTTERMVTSPSNQVSL